MTKAQNKQVAMIQIYINNGMVDTAARSLSALIRSAMTKKSKLELINLSIKYDLHNNSEFII
jgi:hypothetical protein